MYSDIEYNEAKNDSIDGLYLSNGSGAVWLVTEVHSDGVCVYACGLYRVGDRFPNIKKDIGGALTKLNGAVTIYNE